MSEAFPEESSPVRTEEGLYMSGEMLAKAAAANGGGAGGDVVAAAAAVVASSNHHPSHRRRCFNKPSWLLCTIADLDERMNMLTKKVPKQNTSDSFAARANSYYHERPQLLALLHDLYNSYLSLADRYCQALTKNRHHYSSHCSSPSPALEEPNERDTGEVIDSDAESSLSFQLPVLQPQEINADMVVADLVMKSVECDIILNELSVVDKTCMESSRKTELQKNLLDVLESERLILLNDNATLGYRVTALAEENKGLASESLFLKRKVAELARCVLKTREDHRVCALSRKIEDLQGQIHGLEKRNKEYYERLVKRGDRKACSTKWPRKGCKGGEEVNLEECFRVRSGGRGGSGLKKCFSFNLKNGDNQDKKGDEVNEGGRSSASKLWEKVKKFDMFLCGPYLGSMA